MIDLSAAGLSQTEAKCYSTLLQRTAWKPSELAKSVGETRTNCYKILDKLVSLGLAERFDQDKKLHYRTTNPSKLLELARQRRIAHEQAEKQLELQTKDLMEQYIEVHERPGVRFFQGKEEIKTIFKEVAAAQSEVIFVHTLAGRDFYGLDTMHNLRMLAINKGVKRRALTPDGLKAPKDYKDSDERSLLNRTWLWKEDYTENVEWGAFDSKLYIIVYGKDATGIIIDNQAIAAAFKQLFTALEQGQRARPGYEQLPMHAKAASKPARLLPEL